VYRRPIVPGDFAVPERLEGDGFHLRALTIHDLVKDFDAVMTSVDRLVGFMDPSDDWPLGLTLEEDLIDLAWHQREFTMGHSFAYTVMTPDEATCLGCVYLLPTRAPGYDAQAFYWVRTSEVATGLDQRLGAALHTWLAERWPFTRVAFPGREIAWAGWPDWVRARPTDPGVV
jgi:hypothetical protein